MSQDHTAAPDLATQLQAILTGCAVAPLDDRAFLRIAGPDATRWLNGMVTNNIKDLAPGGGNYNFFLNAQGRIAGDGILYREHGDDPSFLLATSAAQLETLHPLLDRFIIMDDVELAPTFPEQSTLLLLGPAAPAVLQALGLPATDPLRLLQASTAHGPVLLTTPSPLSVPAFELRADPATASALLTLAVNAGAVEVSAATLEAFRILSATPRYGTDIRNTDGARDLPQETNQTHALHFNKGCYLGQEIVERIHSRGQVNRLFTQFELTGPLPAAFPVALETTANGTAKPAGELTSAALVPLPGGPKLLALGYARREALAANATFTYPGGSAAPVTPGSF